MKRCRLKRTNFQIIKEMSKKNKTSDKQQNGNDFIADVSHSMTGDGMNSLEFFDMIKREWCVSEEQYRPFWNDVLTFARKYHKERKEYCG
jgi:hypothetical protein